MTKLVGTIADSSGATLSGELTVTQLATVRSDGTIITVKPTVFTITGGAVDITIPANLTERTVCRFLFETISGGSRQTWLDFTAQVPASSTAVAFSSLLPSAVTSDSLDTSVKRLAQIILSDPTLSASLRPTLVPKGVWDNVTAYLTWDVVTVSGSSFICLGGYNVNKNPPDNAGIWQLLAEKGATGAGVTGFPQAYSSAWSGVNSAPTMSDVYNKVSTLAAASALTSLAPLDSPVLTGAPVAPTPPATTNSTRLATAEFIWGLLTNSGLLTPGSLTQPGAPTPAATDASGKIATTQFVRSYIAYTTDNGWACIDIIQPSGKRVRIACRTPYHNQTWTANTAYSFETAAMSGSWTCTASSVKTGMAAGAPISRWADCVATAASWTGTTLVYIVGRQVNSTLTENVPVNIFVLLAEQ